MSPQGTDRLHRVWALLRAWPRSAADTCGAARCALRVVTAIVVLSAVVVGSVGFMVMRQITDGLVKSRVDASVAEARTETSTARERLGSAGGNDFDPETQLRLLVENLVVARRGQGLRGGGARPGRRRAAPAAAYAPRRRSTPPACPASLRKTVERRRERPRVDLHPDPLHRQRPQPTAATSRAWPSGRPSCCPPTAAPTRSTTCSRWARSSRRCCCCAGCCSPPGILLLLLVAGVAALVTRQVINPVRLARRVAERIASGTARGADARRGGGRHRPPRDVVQPDGRGAAVPDPQAGGALAGAAHLRLRRLPRAAHAADHGADGRRRAARRPGELRPRHRAGGRAAADRARPVREPARRPARDQPLRRGRRRARPRGHQPRRRRAPGGGQRRADGAAARGAAVDPSTRACSWPRSTYAGSSGSCATC